MAKGIQINELHDNNNNIYNSWNTAQPDMAFLLSVKGFASRTQKNDFEGLFMGRPNNHTGIFYTNRVGRNF